MQVVINGENQTFDHTLSVIQLLDELGLSGKRLAVEVNESIVPKTQHAATVLNDGDKIEIIHAIGGG